MERSDWQEFNGHVGGGLSNTVPVAMQCPKCGRESTFTESRGVNELVLVATNQQSKTLTYSDAVFGNRICPNPRCGFHVFVVHRNGHLIESFPPQRIKIDESNLPTRLLDALDEALACHAHGCYFAAAMLVRKTLEELCSDQDASGENLKDQIDDLDRVVELPGGILDAMHNLRLLGNDATHVKAKVYEEIGKEELEVAIDVTLVILKSCYQTKGLVDRLDKLKTKGKIT